MKPRKSRPRERIIFFYVARRLAKWTKTSKHRKVVIEKQSSLYDYVRTLRRCSDIGFLGKQASEDLQQTMMSGAETWRKEITCQVQLLQPPPYRCYRHHVNNYYLSSPN